MGLSRNKVAVSEGAAGSPPFYGELRKSKDLSLTSKVGITVSEVNRCLILRVLKESLREDGKDILIAQKENMGV